LNFKTHISKIVAWGDNRRNQKIHIFWKNEHISNQVTEKITKVR